jgi:hypothetical protein
MHALVEQILAEAGHVLNLRRTNDWYMTPLYVAAEQGNTKLVEYLLGKKISMQVEEDSITISRCY